MRTVILAVAGLAFGATACSSGGTSVEVQQNSVAEVSVTLPSPSLTAGQTVQAVATLRDATGASLPNRPIVWQSSSPSKRASYCWYIRPQRRIEVITRRARCAGRGRLTVMATAPVPVGTVS